MIFKVFGQLGGTVTKVTSAFLIYDEETSVKQVIYCGHIKHIFSDYYDAHTVEQGFKWWRAVWVTGGL